VVIDKEGHLVVVDSVNPTIFFISIETGALLKWYDCSEHMREPSDLALYNNEYFICDFKAHCVVIYNNEGQFLKKIGVEQNRMQFPNGLDITRDGDILIGDSHGNRFHLCWYKRSGELIQEYATCSELKVSRCSGLKITSRGFIVTLVKK